MRSLAAAHTEAGQVLVAAPVLGRPDVAAAGNLGMDLLMDPIYEAMEKDPWDLELHFFEGNHEFRVKRLCDLQPEFDGVFSLEKDTNLLKHGWFLHPFLEVVDVDGVAYTHYFTSGVLGRPVTSPRAILTKKFCSGVMGHVQTYGVAMDYDGFGRRITGVFAGTYYQHTEDYLTPQGNAAAHHAIHILHDVHDGEFSINTVELEYLRQRFGGQ